MCVVRQIVKGLFLLFFSVTGLVSAMEIQTLSQAVDIAGKQRMYTQRMLKDYAMIGMHNTFGDPEADLAKTIEDFDAHHKALQSFAKTEATKASLDKVGKCWKPIKKTLLETPQKERVAALQEDLDALLAQANDATVLFAKETGKASGEIINISGRQRMLSQRMAGLYMLKVWGIDDPKFQEKMTDAMALFKRSLKQLQASEMNTQEINNLLTKVENSFMFFEFSKKFIPSLIYKKSNDILRDMNRVTELYVEIEAKR